ncbi:MAG: amine dehydrogenase large subunit [Aggregatilineales bacterium]
MLHKLLLTLTFILSAISVLFIGGSLVSAQFMPRGPELAYSTEVDGTSSIYLLSVRHGLAYSLTSAESPDRTPVWSPDGSMLVYESRALTRQNFNLYVTLLGGTRYNERRLTGNLSGDGSAVWSMDQAETILYVSSPGVTNRIYQMNINDRPFEHQRITSVDYSSYAPHVSPVSGEVLYVSIRDGQYDILGYDPHTGVERFATHDEYIDSSPHWSPDGKRFSFQSYRGDSLDIFVADADGQNIRQLTSERGNDHSAMWSPDGRYIAFTSNRSGNDDIFVLEVDHPENVVRLTTHLAADRNPVWSPDGQYIAFVSYRDNNAEIYLARPFGGAERRLTHDPGQDNFPAWRP